MGKIEIVGLGSGDLKQLPVGVYETIMQHKHVFLRTKEHPVVAELEKEGLSYQSFDDFYEAEAEFESVYEKISATLLEMAKDTDVLYAVPGHPMVAEDSVSLLLANEEGISITIGGGKSFIDDFFQAVSIDPIDGFQLVDGLRFSPDRLDTGSHLIIMQVFDDLVAGEVKITLMEQYPDEHPIALVDGAGTKDEHVSWIPLYEMDHFSGVRNLQSVYVPPLDLKKRTKSFSTTQYLMDEIFEKDIWVQAQTHESLLPYLLEESEEVAEAINLDDSENLIEELGDILLQVFYHAAYAENQGDFSMEDILDALNKKLRRRHPHVFDGYPVETIEDIDAMWQEIKRKEKEDDYET